MGDLSRLVFAVAEVKRMHQMVLVDDIEGEDTGVYECAECHYEADNDEPCPTVAVLQNA